MRKIDPPFTVAVRVKANRSVSSEMECQAEVKKQAEARRILKEFKGNNCPSKRQTIVILPMFYAKVESVPNCFNLRKGETVLIQTFARGKFREFFASDGSAVPCPSSHHFLEAFAHASFHLSKGTYVISGMKGVYRRQHEDLSEVLYFLTTITIHSLEKTFGSKDRGEEGIRAFFQNHRCTEMCRNMRRYSGKQEGYENLKGFISKSSASNLGPLLPTAPPVEEVSDLEYANSVFQSLILEGLYIRHL